MEKSQPTNPYKTKKKKKTTNDRARSCHRRSSPAQQFLLIVERGSIMGKEIWVTLNPRFGPLLPILIFSSCTSTLCIGFSRAQTYPSRPPHSRSAAVSRGRPNVVLLSCPVLVHRHHQQHHDEIPVTHNHTFTRTSCPQPPIQLAISR
jgi:hypothetical protein